MSEKISKPVPVDIAAEIIGAETAPPDPARPSPAERKEIGGPKGPDPTRFGDWERNGRCIDF
jgi:hypothetical protein